MVVRGGSFKEMLEKSNMILISQQMEKMTRKFAIKCSKSENFSKWFELSDTTNTHTRSLKPLYKPEPARTARYKASPIPHLTNILNEMEWTRQQRR